MTRIVCTLSDPFWPPFASTLQPNTGVFRASLCNAGCRNLIPLWFSISGMRPGSDNPSAGAPRGVGSRDRSGLWILAPLCCLDCGFLRREGAGKEPGQKGRGSTCSCLICTPLPPRRLVLAYHLRLGHVPPVVVAFFYVHPPAAQSHKSDSGTEASLEEMPTSPRVSTWLLCDLGRSFLAGVLR